MAGLSPIGPGSGPTNVNSNDSASGGRDALLKAASTVSETANSGANARAVDLAAVQGQSPSSPAPGLGNAIDVRG